MFDHFLGSIPIDFLLVGFDIQPTAGRKNEQVQCYTDFGKHFERFGQGEGDSHHFGRIPQFDRKTIRTECGQRTLHRNGSMQSAEAALDPGTASLR